ncbi:MAG: hypothetical protein LBL58_14485 [Tannerellaceae bacterium]|jgi:hypothetical protein|nr:hypothetical protein [Tannerellaceae bacterium]
METRKISLALFVFLMLAVHTMLAQDKEVVVSITNDMDSKQLKQIMEKNASLLLTAFNKAARTGKKPVIPPGIVTGETKRKLNALWSMSAMACKASVIQEKYLTTYKKEYQIRNIPMIMYAATSDSTQYEEIALNFAPDGMISDIGITVKEHQYMQVEWLVPDTEQEQRIKEFIDLLRDAYNCKDIKTLGSIWSNNMLSSDRKMAMQVQTKSEYLEKMKYIFKKNEYLNIVFDSIEIAKHPNPELKEIYGVTLKQYWNSSTYRDAGYLFLLIDCSDKNRLEIPVRTWQPEEEIDSYDDIFGLGSFMIENVL